MKTQKVEISPEGPTVIIGERLNPTGYSRLAEALREGDWDLIRQEATSQVKQIFREAAANSEQIATI